MRFPRFFSKKRGHRRTGSEAWGSIGEGLFHAALVAAGLVFGGLLVTGIAVPEWRINHDFRESQGTVVGKGLARRITAAGTTWQPCLRLRFETEAGSREAWAMRGSVASDRNQALSRLGGMELGETLPCWYDPAAPETVVLARGYKWWMWTLTLLLPGALLAFGGAGLARSLGRWGKSEERRAAGGTLPLERLVSATQAAEKLPAVPSCDDLVNSPGTVLKYRLPISGPESWTLLGFGLFAVLWNTVLVVLAVNAGLDLLGGRIDPLLAVVLVPFALVGVTGIVLYIRELILSTAVGTTQVEISDHPLRPGGRYDVLLAQGGSGTFRDLSLVLEAEEQATFRQGTDTRIERLVVWRSPLESWRDVQVTPGTRFEVRSTLRVPPAAMHSFATEHNAISWRVVVRGRPSRWPGFSRYFPVVVHPAGPAGRQGTAAEARA